eukprot:COSAG02_NODE_1446_length_12578_cov_3.488661_2_plen_55_part_00
MNSVSQHEVVREHMLDHMVLTRTLRIGAVRAASAAVANARLSIVPKAWAKLVVG